MLRAFIKRNKQKIFSATSSSYHDLDTLIRHFDLSPLPPKVLYLGDSVVERVSRDDQDKRTLGQMVSDALQGEKSSLCISHSAYHINLYHHFVLALEKMRNKPEVLIFPINLRSFSPQWDWEPSWQFNQEINCLKGYSRMGTIIYKPNEVDMTLAYELFDSRPVEYPNTSLTTIGQFRLIVNSKPMTKAQKDFRLQQIFIFHYMHDLEITHSKLLALVEMIKLLKSMGVRVFCYITPVNYQAGENFVGLDFLASLQKNISKLEKVITPLLVEHRVSFYNYANLLGSQYFFHKDLATEHIDQNGRNFLSSRIIQDGFASFNTENGKKQC